MDHLIGLTGNGYALIAADRKVAHSIIAVKHDEDKILQLDSHKLLACAGELGDTKNFSEFIQKNMALYQLRNGIKLSTHAAAHYTRSEIAASIRSAPKMCNMILVGHDDDAGPGLYHMDYIGGMHKMNFAAHGYGGYFALSLLDRCGAIPPSRPSPPPQGIPPLRTPPPPASQATSVACRRPRIWLLEHVVLFVCLKMPLGSAFIHPENNLLCTYPVCVPGHQTASHLFLPTLADPRTSRALFSCITPAVTGFRVDGAGHLSFLLLLRRASQTSIQKVAHI